MSTRKRSALIAGASGLVGGFCLQRLLQDERYSMTYSLVRTATRQQHPRLSERLVNFDKLDQTVDFPAVDDVYCCLGTTIGQAGSKEAFEKVDLDYVVAVASLARKNGAQRCMLVSALGADPVSSVFYNRIKGRMEVELQQLDFPALHIFRPSLLTGPRKDFRLGERLATPLAVLLRPVLRGSLARYRAVHADHVASCMVKAAFSPVKGVEIHYPSETGKSGGP
ncbi:MAG: oxidoreductase [Gammaproteobacteria bacterium]|jgi:uncharacterized protein YbjT (DUF2867 family)|nr:oxidoreductase [Gammaproteobacteria bacterium]